MGRAKSKLYDKGIYHSFSLTVIRLTGTDCVNNIYRVKDFHSKSKGIQLELEMGD